MNHNAYETHHNISGNDVKCLNECISRAKWFPCCHISDFLLWYSQGRCLSVWFREGPNIPGNCILDAIWMERWPSDVNIRCCYKYHSRHVVRVRIRRGRVSPSRSPAQNGDPSRGAGSSESGWEKGQTWHARISACVTRLKSRSVLEDILPARSAARSVKYL